MSAKDEAPIASGRNQQQEDDSKVPRVLILMTGGTICMQPSPRGLIPAGNFLATCLASRPSFNDNSPPSTLSIITEDGSTQSLTALRTPKSGYGHHIHYCVYEFDPLLDSSSVAAPVWLKIASHIQANYHLFTGFVVLHGTDTLAFSASALSFMLQDLGKPVILTGSQRPMGELQNDATDNLLGSLIIAAHFNIPECGLYFNYKLFRGNRATKVSATDYDAFASPNLPPLARVTSTGVHVRWDLVHKTDPSRTFRLQKRWETAHIAYIRIFPGITPELVEMILQAKPTKGLVLESFGAGNIPNGKDGKLLKVLTDAVKKGIVVVNITQCLNGNVSPLYAPALGLQRAGVLLGYDMTAEAALTKLSFLLATGLEEKEVRRLMEVSVRGELTTTPETWFKHPPMERGGKL